MGCATAFGGTFSWDCVNLLGAGFRLKFCVHSPDAHFRRGVRLWHTLSRFLSLVGVNAVSSKVYYAWVRQTRFLLYLNSINYKLERAAPMQSLAVERHVTPTQHVIDRAYDTGEHHDASVQLSNEHK